MGSVQKKSQNGKLRAVSSAVPQNSLEQRLPSPPSPEVVAKPERRWFSAQYKRQILAEADACTESGQVGALLRREGLYSSHLTDWRRQREQGIMTALESHKRGRKESAPDPSAGELARTRQALARTESKLKQAEKIIEIQKKVSELLGLQLETPPPMDDEENVSSSSH